jgi:hypothetical protein
MTDKRYAELFWTPPQDFTSIKGSITGYTVKLMVLSPWVSTTRPLPAVQKGKGKHFARCENLMPCAQYRGSVFIERPNGAIKPDLPYTVTFTTLPRGE